MQSASAPLLLVQWRDDQVSASGHLALRQRTSDSTGHIENSESGTEEDAHLSNFAWQQRIFEHNHGYYTDDLSMLKESSPSSTVYFRLLITQPGGFHDPLVCWLITEELSDGVGYDAFSYTWGKGDSSMRSRSTAKRDFGSPRTHFPDLGASDRNKKSERYGSMLCALINIIH